MKRKLQYVLNVLKEKKTAVISVMMAVCMLTQNSVVMADSQEDVRTPFTILEIIPHKACSIFPYMVDWGDKESYDANVPIGYDGIVKMVNTLGGIRAATGEAESAGNSLFYTYTYRGIKRETLDDYNVLFAADENDKSANWYRTYEEEEQYDRTESGYFLRVQDGKGLYSLCTPVTDVVTPGIGLGGYEVADFRAYMLKGDAEALIGQNWDVGGFMPAFTEANYVLAFYPKGSGYRGDYKYNIKEAMAREGGEYALDAEYDTNGKYGVSYAEEDEEGLYVRVAEKTMDDGYENSKLSLADGYFRLYDTARDDGKVRYRVMFVESTVGTYKEQFVYTGEEKGNFDVWFMYTAGVGQYAPKKLKVALGAGEYVAVSATGQEGLYQQEAKYVKAENGDYDLMIRSAAAMPVNQDETEDYNWVWVSVDDENKMKTTLYDEYLAGQDKVGTRIYLNNYTRKYAYYSMWGFINNEWLKLRCLLSDPANNSKPYPYDTNKTCIQNLEAASDALKRFDVNHRIEIMSVTPGEVTTEMVAKADLIYFSDQEGIEGIKKNWGWLTGDDSVCEETQFQYNNDISFSIALQIYYKCIVREEAALMMNMYLATEDYDTKGYVTKNYAKLYFMINFFYPNKTLFLDFLESSGQYNEDFSMVKDNGTVVATHAPDFNENYYNRHSAFADQENIVSFCDNAWYPAYFTVYLDKEAVHYDPTYQCDFLMDRMLNEPSDTYLAFDWYTAGWFCDFKNMEMIWEILQNRNTPMTLDITNASLTGGGKLVIYVDELDDTFSVNYVVNSEDVGNAVVTMQFADSIGTEIVSISDAVLNAEQTANVRRGFTNPYWSDAKTTSLASGIRKRKVSVRATSGNGGVVSTEVWVIVRDFFDLN